MPGTQAFLPVRPAELHSAVCRWEKRAGVSDMGQRVENQLAARAVRLCSCGKQT
jgi:hypothetical protein